MPQLTWVAVLPDTYQARIEAKTYYTEDLAALQQEWGNAQKLLQVLENRKAAGSQEFTPDMFDALIEAVSAQLAWISANIDGCTLELNALNALGY